MVSATCGLYACWRLFFLVLAEEFAPAVEIFLELYADALCGKGGLNEVSVVGLVVGFQCDAAGGGEQVTDVEVADEVVCGVVAFAVSEVAVYEESVVEQASA